MSDSPIVRLIAINLIMTAWVYLALTVAFTHSFSASGSCDCLRIWFQREIVSQMVAADATKRVGQEQGDAEVDDKKHVESV